MRAHRNFLLPFLLLVLSACATFGIEQPQTFGDRAALVYAGVDGVVKASTNALNAHTISSNDAEYVRNTAVTTRAFLTTAEATLASGDAAGANERLAMAESVLKSLQTYLARKGAK